MEITKVDPLTGRVNTRDIDVTDFQLALWRDGALIQDVMPNVSADDREFIMTGIVWEDSFSDD